MRETFDPAVVVANMEANGVAPDADMWRVEGHRIFVTLPSPAKLLRDNAKVDTIDSHECPARRRALGAIEGQALPQWIDIPLIGEDGWVPSPRPHAAQREDKLNFGAEGGAMTVTGWRSLQPLLGPVYAAADACMSGRLMSG